MSAWRNLERELDDWQRLGRKATLWWRDDDAVEPTPPLSRLTKLSGDYGIPVAVAAIPADSTPSLAEQLAICGNCTILQHGYSHKNNAPTDQKKAEFGPHRNHDEMICDLTEGTKKMRNFKGVYPALVPPWNRIDLGLFARLPKIGFRAISTFGPRKSACPAFGLKQINTHVDPVSWHSGRIFAGKDAVLGQMTGHLSARRKAEVDADEPTGLLTHHLVCDEAGWSFLEALFETTKNHPAADWLSAKEAFGK